MNPRRRRHRRIAKKLRLAEHAWFVAMRPFLAAGMATIEGARASFVLLTKMQAEYADEIRSYLTRELGSK